MPYERIRLADTFKAQPSAIYAAWLDAAKHAEMTGGGPATSDGKAGGEFSAWDGYIKGQYTELSPNARITMTWRTNDFAADDDDSKVVVTFEKDPDGTRVTVVHSEIPAGQGVKYEEGWGQFYFDPMHKLFG